MDAMTENELQNICMDLSRQAGVDVMHIPNESGDATRHALGMRKGVADLLLVGKSVMFVELKRNENIQPSFAQQQFATTLRKNKIQVALVGSVDGFRKVLIKVNREKSQVRVGSILPMRGKECDTPELKRVSKFYLDRQMHYAPEELFAVKLYSWQQKSFPWLCNVRDRYFVATKPSKVTSKILYAGWDIVYV